MYNLKKTLQEIVVEVIDLDALPAIVLKEIEVEDLDFGPSDPFAPYSEVRFLKSEILPYGTRFSIPYFKEEVRHRFHLVKGETHWSEPCPEPCPEDDVDDQLPPPPRPWS